MLPHLPPATVTTGQTSGSTVRVTTAAFEMSGDRAGSGTLTRRRKVLMPRSPQPAPDPGLPRMRPPRSATSGTRKCSSTPTCASRRAAHPIPISGVGAVRPPHPVSCSAALSLAEPEVPLVAGEAAQVQKEAPETASPIGATEPSGPWWRQPDAWITPAVAVAVIVLVVIVLVLWPLRDVAAATGTLRVARDVDPVVVRKLDHLGDQRLHDRDEDARRIAHAHGRPRRRFRRLRASLAHRPAGRRPTDTSHRPPVAGTSGSRGRPDYGAPGVLRARVGRGCSASPLSVCQFS